MKTLTKSIPLITALFIFVSAQGLAFTAEPQKPLAIETSAAAPVAPAPKTVLLLFPYQTDLPQTMLAIGAGFAVLILLAGYLAMLNRRLNTARLELSRMNAHLEAQVQERTAALSQANRRLEAEIAERIQAEAGAREKAEDFERFFSNALDLLCIADTDGYFRRLNREWERTLGYSVAELQGQHFLDFVHPDDLVDTLAAIGTLQRQQEILNFTNRYRCRDNSYRWIEWRSIPVGKLIYAAARDITKRKQIEEALRVSEEKFRSIIEQSADAIMLTDETGRLVEWNTATERISGLKRPEVLGQMVWDIQFRLAPAEIRTPVLHKQFESFVQTILQTGHYPGMDKVHEVKIQRPDGIYQMIESSDFSIKTEQGFLLGSIIRDITERKRIEEALRQSEELFRAIFESAAIGIVLLDADTNLLLINPALEQFMGRSVEELRQLGVQAVTHPQDWEADHQLFAEVYAGQRRHYSIEKRYLRRDGQIIWGQLTLSGIYNSAGNITHAIAMIEDITARKWAEAERERLITELQETLAKVNQLEGMLPICSFCKKIRDEAGTWQVLEVYIRGHSQADFSHGMCPDCAKAHYPEFYNK